MGLRHAVAVVVIVLGTVVPTTYTQGRFRKFLLPDTSDHIFRPDSFRKSNSFKDAQRELINAPLPPSKSMKRQTERSPVSYEPLGAAYDADGDADYDQPQSDYYPSSQGGGYYGGRRSSSSPGGGYGYGSASPEYVPGASGGGGGGYYSPSGGRSGSGGSYGGSGYGGGSSGYGSKGYGGGGYGGGSSGYGSKGYGGSSGYGGYGDNQGYGDSSSSGYGSGSQGQGYSQGRQHSGYSQGYPEEKSYLGSNKGHPRGGQDADDVEVQVEYGDGGPVKVIEQEDYGTSYNMDDYKDVLNDFAQHNYDHYQPPPEVGEYPEGGRSHGMEEQGVRSAADRYKDTVGPYLYYGGQDRVTSSMYNSPQTLIMSGSTQRQLPEAGNYGDNGEMEFRAMNSQPPAHDAEQQYGPYEPDNFHRAHKQITHNNLPLEATLRQRYTQETIEPYRNNIDQRYGDIAHSVGYKKGQYHPDAHRPNNERKSRYQNPHWQEQSDIRNSHEGRSYTDTYHPREESWDAHNDYYAEDKSDTPPPSYHTENTAKGTWQGPQYSQSKKRGLYDQRPQGRFDRKQPSLHVTGKGNYLGHTAESRKSPREVNKRYAVQYSAQRRQKNNYGQYLNGHDGGSLYTRLKSPGYKSINDYPREAFSGKDRHQGPPQTTYSSPRALNAADHTYAPMRDDLRQLATIYYVGRPNNPNHRDGKFTRGQRHQSQHRHVDVKDHPVKSPHQQKPLKPEAHMGFARKAKEMMLGRPFRLTTRPHRGSLRGAFRSGYGLPSLPV